MNAKGLYQQCALVMIADGFNEMLAIAILSTLRRAGICVKSVGLTSGLMSGSHGILILPDFTLGDLEQAVDLTNVKVVVLPGGKRSHAHFEADPRIHRLLRQVAECQGLIIVDAYGVDIVKAAIGQSEGSDRNLDEQIVLCYTRGQPVEQFAQNLAYKLGASAGI